MQVRGKELRSHIRQLLNKKTKKGKSGKSKKNEARLGNAEDVALSKLAELRTLEGHSDGVRRAASAFCSISRCDTSSL